MNNQVHEPRDDFLVIPSLHVWMTLFCKSRKGIHFLGKDKPQNVCRSYHATEGWWPAIFV